MTQAQVSPTAGPSGGNPAALLPFICLGPFDLPRCQVPDADSTPHQLLYSCWACWRCWHSTSPCTMSESTLQRDKEAICFTWHWGWALGAGVKYRDGGSRALSPFQASAQPHCCLSATLVGTLIFISGHGRQHISGWNQEQEDGLGAPGQMASRG